MTPDTELDLDNATPDRSDRRVGVAMWLASAGTHAAALAIMGAIYWTVAESPPEELPPLRPAVIPQPPQTVEQEPPPSTADQPINLPIPSDLVEPFSQLDVVTSVDPQGDSDASPDLPPMVQGDPLALADVELGSNGMLMSIGAGDLGARKIGGPYAGRGTRGPRGPHGAPPWAKRSTTSALAWFRRHQSPDGSWEAVGYFRNCTDNGPKGEPGKMQNGETDVAMTAYAVLCFLGDGYDHRTPSTHRTAVRRGLEWLLAKQTPEGLVGARNYEHGIAAMALTQAYGMAPDPWLRDPSQRAVDIILDRQNRDPQAKAPYDRLGWDYGRSSARNDASVTGWNIMALKAAHVAGLRVGDGLTGAKSWLERHWEASNTGKPWSASVESLDPYRGSTRFGYVWNHSTGEVQISGWDAAASRPASTDHHDLAPVGLMSAAFLGFRAGDAMLETLGNYVSTHHMPKSWPVNTYYLYYNTLGMYQLGGERWERWAKTVLPMLNEAQDQSEGCNAGSWPWQGTRFHGHDTGRVLSTAYACLSMQVYWIYDKQVQERKRG